MPEQAPVLWLSGWSTGLEVWRAEWERLPGEHRTVDLRGCRSADELPAAVATAAAPLGPEARVVAWSLGAMAALEAAARLGLPARRLLLVGASGRFARTAPGEPGWPAAVLERMRTRLGDDLEGLVRDFHGRLFSPQEAAAGFPARWWEQAGGTIGGTAEGLAVGLEYLERLSLLEDAGRIRAEVHLLHGAADPICPLAAAEALAAALPDATLTVLDGVGHVPFFTARERFRAWLDGLL